MSKAPYLTLAQAYDLLGKALHGKPWDYESIYLSPTRKLQESGFPDRYDPAEHPENIDDPDLKGIAEPATCKQVQQFKATQAELVRSVSLEGLAVKAIDQSGREAPLPDAVWTEGQTRFELWLPESEVHECRGEQRIWAVYLHKAGVEAVAKRLESERTRDERKERARSSKSGRPTTLPWQWAEREIEQQLDRLGCDTPHAQIARAVEAAMGTANAPTYSHLRERVKELKQNRKAGQTRGSGGGTPNS